ncbi:MAG: hypothetical protein GXP35_00835 [Actinobacteria bacterium]|nr:hypothetical protein [Actinomycetota bacterium]
MLSALLAIQWDPDITGYLAVIIGVVVLCGSVYLLLATNVGTRLGFLIAFCGLTGWIFLMAIIWWVYGIGLVGEGPSWQPLQVTTSLASSTIDDVRDLDSVEIGAGAPAEWTIVAESASGDVFAAADAEIVCPPGDERLLEVVSNCLFGSAQAIEHHRAFVAGGERFRPLGIPDNVVTDFFIPSRGRPHYAVVQVQEFAAVAPSDLNSDAAIPDPVVDPTAPIWSVVMVRDQGSLRLPPFLITLGSGLLFALTAYQLHRRDLAIMEMRQKAG